MMKRLVLSTLLLLMASLSFPIIAKESISEHAKNVDSLWRVGAGAQDGAYTATSLSMLGWGFGLATGIAILAASLHKSKAGHHGHCD
ncbi:MAG: hypothetical protein ACM3JI_05445 [Anaerolineae bacterium]